MDRATSQAAPFTRIPIVDIARWTGASNADERRAFARDVDDVCRTTGFMYVVGHDVPPALVDAVFAQSRAFFALPQEAKARIDFRRANRYRGYIPLQGESSDPTAAPDLKEAFDFGLQHDDAAATGAMSARLRAPNQWPLELPAFRVTLEAYFTAVRTLAETLFEVFSVIFALPQTYFADKIDRPIAQMRVLHYPPSRPAPDTYGIGAHCDYECFTILAQDDAGGLEVQNQVGQWVAAPPIAGAFIINIGEMLARWTNDRFKATPHRVINTSGRERFSIPFFFATNDDTIVEPLIARDSDEPPHYAPIRAGDYLAARLDEIYATPAAG